MGTDLHFEPHEDLVGSRIRMLEHSELRTLKALDNLTGVIIHVISGEPMIGVQFDIAPEGAPLHNCHGNGLDGYCYYVHRDEFEIIDHEDEEKELEVMKMYAQEKFGEWIPDRFPLVGEKVIPNPETSTGQEILRKYGDDVTGLVVDTGATKFDLQTILSSGERHMPNWNITVIWRGEHQEYIEAAYLLPLSGGTEEVIHVEGRDERHNHIKEYAYNEKTYEKLDKAVVQKQIREIRIEKFNEKKNNSIRNNAYRKIMKN